MRRSPLRDAIRLTAILAGLGLLDIVANHEPGSGGIAIAVFGALPVVLFGAAALTADGSGADACNRLSQDGTDP